MIDDKQRKRVFHMNFPDTARKVLQGFVDTSQGLHEGIRQ